MIGHSPRNTAEQTYRQEISVAGQFLQSAEEISGERGGGPSRLTFCIGPWGPSQAPRFSASEQNTRAPAAAHPSQRGNGWIHGPACAPRSANQGWGRGFLLVTKTRVHLYREGGLNNLS